MHLQVLRAILSLPFDQVNQLDPVCVCVCVQYACSYWLNKKNNGQTDRCRKEGKNVLVRLVVHQLLACRLFLGTPLLLLDQESPLPLVHLLVPGQYKQGNM